jgi:predicted O-methyltransferase YrrM
MIHLREDVVMNTVGFLEAIQPLVAQRLGFPFLRKVLRKLRVIANPDPCPDVCGMASPRKLRLLNKAVEFLPAGGDECYLEIGTFQGKSLIGALQGNAGRSAVACDNFSLFEDPVAPRNQALLQENLARYGIAGQVRLFDCDFRELLGRWKEDGLPPVGVYFFDGPHDEESQYLGVRLVEDLLADEAIVVIDDWRLAADSESYAEAGTRRAVAASSHRWTIEHVLPARYNGDRELWWNGIAVLRFQAAGARAAQRPGELARR